MRALLAAALVLSGCGDDSGADAGNVDLSTSSDLSVAPDLSVARICRPCPI